MEHLPRPRKERVLPGILSTEQVEQLISHGRTLKHQVYDTIVQHGPSAERGFKDKLRSRMLPVPYCHITFTLPHDLNGLARRTFA